ncbi:KptA family-domain-containing protein [Trametes gibbosa]|nr:KptA family-domain-containing protein [Trametes gibbosa]
MSANQDPSGEGPQVSREDRRPERPAKDRNRGGSPSGGGRGSGRGGGSAKLRGHPKDSLAVRTSKTLSWILRHGSQSEGLAMRADGYVRVNDLLQRPKMGELTLGSLQEIVKSDAKGRYSLLLETDPNGGDEVWWIRANQGHSMKAVVLDYEPIKSVTDIPTGIAVHGTTKRAWESIKNQGLSKMSRNHIHLAQGVVGSGVISGMRKSSQIFIYVDVQKAIDAGIKFYISANGVVLTDGDEGGFLSTQFFSQVDIVDGKITGTLPGWGRPQRTLEDATSRSSITIGTAQPSEVDMTKRSVGVGSVTKEEAVQAVVVSEQEIQEMEKKIASTGL